MSPTTVAVLAVCVTAIVGAVAFLPEWDNRVCRTCRHYVNAHEHWRNGLDCSVKACGCKRYRSRRFRDAVAQSAADALHYALGWLADIASALIGATDQVQAEKQRHGVCLTCQGPKELATAGHCLGCVAAGRVPSDVNR